MEPDSKSQYHNPDLNTRGKRVHAIAIPFNNLISDRIIAGLLINVVLIIVLLLSRKSWGG